MKHTILDRCMKLIEDRPAGREIEQYYILLCFCFVIDFFEIDDFFEGYEIHNRKRASKRCDNEGISYDKDIQIETYKKTFFHDSTRNTNPHRISNTLLSFWDYLKITLSSNEFSKSLNNEVQRNILKHILNNIANDEPDSLLNLLQDYDSFVHFFGGHIVQDDCYMNQYYLDKRYSDYMFELLNGEDFYTYEDVPFPQFTLFEELYENEIKNYAIYNDILSKINILSIEHTSTDLNVLVQEDLSYWKHVINNWDVMKLFYDNYSVWDSYLNYIVFKCDSSSVSLEEFIDCSLYDLSSICQDSDRQKSLIINILEKSHKYFAVLNYKPFINNYRLNSNDVTNVVNKISKRITFYNSELFLDFCIKYKSKIKELDYESISFLHKLLVIKNLTA